MPERERRAPKSTWLVDVDVYLEDAGDAETGIAPRFRLETCLPMARNGPSEMIAFHNRGRHGFEIRFNLIDETNSGYRFPPTNARHHALWSMEGECCPPDNYGQQWPQFTATRVIEPDLTTLVVRNLNESTTRFGYTLRITKDGGRSYVNLDPVGDNHNGSYS